jgi:ABC-type molybdenum transport system ATPase subunit/photorepair protein PhrA
MAYEGVELCAIEVEATEQIADSSYASLAPENSPCALSWKDLVVTTKVSKAKVQKQLLNNLNGSITGGLWAIMGSSGSGSVSFEHFFVKY